MSSQIPYSKSQVLRLSVNPSCKIKESSIPKSNDARLIGLSQDDSGFLEAQEMMRQHNPRPVQKSMQNQGRRTPTTLQWSFRQECLSVLDCSSAIVKLKYQQHISHPKKTQINPAVASATMHRIAGMQRQPGFNIHILNAVFSVGSSWCCSMEPRNVLTGAKDWFKGLPTSKHRFVPYNGRLVSAGGATKS